MAKKYAKWLQKRLGKSKRFYPRDYSIEAGLSSSQGVPGYYVSEDGNGVGTQADPFGPSEFEAALASIPSGSSIFFNKGDEF